MDSQRRPVARITSVFLIILLFLMATACTSGTTDTSSTQSVITVEVEGSEGVHFSGNLGDQISKETFTDLPVPSTLKLEDPVGSIILSVRKVESGGLIKATVFRDGDVVDSGETSSPFGMINLTVSQD